MTSDRILDWRSRHDPRSRNYAMRPMLDPSSAPTSRIWQEGPILDQGREGACVGFGWMGEALAEPIAPDPLPITAAAQNDALAIYHLAQTLDDFPGEDYSGTSVLAGAKAMQQKGYLAEYRWCFSVDDLRDTILSHGPVVIGVPWYSGMYTAPSGLVTVSGELVGGHCLVVTGYFPEWHIGGITAPMFRWRNSWGPDYGINGSAYITVSDMDRLIHEGGEMCVPVVRTIPAAEPVAAEPAPEPAPTPTSTATPTTARRKKVEEEE